MFGWCKDLCKWLNSLAPEKNNNTSGSFANTVWVDDVLGGSFVDIEAAGQHLKDHVE